MERVLLASPRGFCAGVERAVESVEKALERYGAPVYVRKQIVHNIHVVRDLETRGAVFVDDVGQVPEGATVVSSAVAYYGAVTTYRWGLDPDNFGIPLVTSLMDLAGTLCLILGIVLFVGNGSHG